jgi:hypothetical protein
MELSFIHSDVRNRHPDGAGAGAGAGASLASASMAGLQIDITTYTFGQPRIGNTAYADMIDRVLIFGKMFRVAHFNDGVPQTITIRDGYRHHSTEFWENDPAGAETTIQCSGKEPPISLKSCLGRGFG